MDGLSSAKQLSSLGVARVSYGPIPYVRLMKSLGEQAQAVLTART
jgi:2-methylisocitrate lyase-like PEP mutase family enzyme